MKRKKTQSLVILIYCLSITCYCQKQTIDFPKGIYKTFQDFKRKIPSDSITQFSFQCDKKRIAFRFYNIATEKRLRKEFAISTGSDLFVNIKGLIQNFDKDDIGQLKDEGNYHLMAKLIGNRYLYFEDYFTSSEAALLGGLIGGTLARRLKGVLYNYETKTFNLFKNIEDFEEFVTANHPEYLELIHKIQDENKQAKRKERYKDIELIREIIRKVYKAANDPTAD